MHPNVGDTMDTTSISGISLTLIGMGVVFSALILLAIAASILERVFRESPGPAPTEKGGHDGDLPSDVKAAITLALAYHLKKKETIHMEGVRETMWIQQSRVYE
jgi:Na+-transporting methylmalonyl-CoA/oxaloacetate decarboxylase gamma subunit